MADATQYVPTVAWRTKASNVFRLTKETESEQATYRITVSVIDTNDIGNGQKEIGYYFADNVGTPYKIIAVDVNTIDVADDFRTGYAPTNGKVGIIYKSVGDGGAPYLAPIYYQFLHPMALENAKRYELDILWRKDGSVTGFIDKDNINVSYDWTTRKITLTGDLRYKFRGVPNTLGTSWTSDAHAATVGKWFLYSTDGINFTWSNLVWGFSNCWVAMVNYKTTAANTFAIRETHGLMDADSHEELHQTQGTYLDPVNGGGLATAGTYTINTASDASTTIGFDQAVVKDEDLRTVIPAWIQGTYTTMKIGVGSITEFNIASSFPFTSTGSFMQVNNPLTGAMTNGINNRFYNIYQCLIPVTSDSDSQKYRMAMIQPQKEFTTQIAAEAEDANSLLFGDLTNLTAEFKVYARLTYQTNTGDMNTGKCRLMSITYVSGTRSNSFNVGGIVPVINPFVLEFTSTDTPSIPDYTIYANLYGQYPTIKLFEVDGSGNRIERTEKPYFTIVSNLITAVSFWQLPEPISGFILISKT